MGLRIVPNTRTAEGVLVESVYEGLAAAPPFLGADLVALGRITAPQYIVARTVCQPGSLLLELSPANSNERSGLQLYELRDGEPIYFDGSVDYDARLRLIPNGCVTATGIAAAPTLCSPVSSCMIRLYWGNGKAPTIRVPADQGAICPALRISSIASGAVVTSSVITLPQSGRGSFIADYTAGGTGDVFLIQGPVTTSIALAALGAWTVPDLIAGQEVQIRLRNTTVGAIAASIDLRVVRT